MVLYEYNNYQNNVDMDYDECYNLYFNKNKEDTFNPYLYDILEDPLDDETYMNLYILESYLIYSEET
jgi:hypothetical protein